MFNHLKYNRIPSDTEDIEVFLELLYHCSTMQAPH